MKILDIRGNLIKIESSNPVGVASLLKISENNQEYLAQVLYTENIVLFSENNIDIFYLTLHLYFRILTRIEETK